jgi:hypothetical protein
MRNEAERASVIEQYRAHLVAQVMSGAIAMEDLVALHGKDLYCWCAPRACHGDVLEKAALWASVAIRDGLGVESIVTVEW